MESKQETKLNNRLKTWEVARQKKDEFIGHRLNGEHFEGKDPFEMGVAFADEARAWAYYQLAEIEAYPNLYSEDRVNYLKEKIKKLNNETRAFKVRQWPS